MANEATIKRSGWAIVHPNGWIEMDYFDTRNFHTGPDRNYKRISAQKWRETFRPDCQMVRVTVNAIIKIWPHVMR